MRKSILFTAVALAATTLGCSSGPETFGDRLINDAQQTEAIGKNWNDGQRLIEKGQKLKAKAEKLASESRDAMTEAETLIAKGTSMISDSEDTVQAQLDILRR